MKSNNIMWSQGWFPCVCWCVLVHVIHACLCTHVAQSGHTDPCVERKATVPGWNGTSNSSWFQCSALHTLVPQPNQLRPGLDEHLQSRPPKFHWCVCVSFQITLTWSYLAGESCSVALEVFCVVAITMLV